MYRFSFCLVNQVKICLITAIFNLISKTEFIFNKCITASACTAVKSYIRQIIFQINRIRLSVILYFYKICSKLFSRYIITSILRLRFSNFKTFFRNLTYSCYHKIFIITLQCKIAICGSKLAFYYYCILCIKILWIGFAFVFHYFVSIQFNIVTIKPPQFFRVILSACRKTCCGK